MSAFRALIVKDLRILLRKRGGFLSAFALGAIIMLMASLSGEATPTSLGQRGAAAFWMGLFMGSTLFLSDSFETEQRDGGQRALILLGASPTAFFYSKALVNFLGLFVVGILLTPISAALFGVGPSLENGVGGDGRSVHDVEPRRNWRLGTRRARAQRQDLADPGKDGP